MTKCHDMSGQKVWHDICGIEYRIDNKIHSHKKHKTMKVTAIRHKDVRGKELLYIGIENSEGNSVLINVGKSTLEGVEKLQKEEDAKKQPTLPNLGGAVK